MWDNVFSWLQKLGRALMIPIAVMPAAGILLGVGNGILQGVERGAINIESELILGLLRIMGSSGDAVFGALPLLFAIGVAIAFSKNDGVAALAALVGYVVLLGAMSAIAAGFNIPTRTVLGLQTIDTGVFGGIVIGLVASSLFNRFYNIKLPTFLGFFAGKRFVPIATSFAAIALALVLVIIWTPVQSGISAFSNWAVGGQQTLAVTIYGFVERLMVPFGLHHVWNTPWHFEIGEFTTVSGELVRGDIARCFAGDPTAGILAGGYLFKMFGLVGAALAMYLTARPERKAAVFSIMSTGALTSFLTGITEPLEFSFLFVAPLLYGIHAILAGLGYGILNILGTQMCFSFSHGFIDYFLFSFLGTNTGAIIVVGIVYFILYLAVFYFAIRLFNLKTPGREDPDQMPEGDGSAPASGKGGVSTIGRDLVLAFGGRNNLTNVDNCITRLRISVKDSSLVNENKLKALGAAGVIIAGTGVQAVFGPQVESMREEMDKYLASGESDADEISIPSPPTIASAASSTTTSAVTLDPQEVASKAAAFLQALGGAKNVKELEATAATRLKVTVADDEQVDESALREAGLFGFMPLSRNTFHLLVGLSADQYVTEMRSQLA